MNFEEHMRTWGGYENAQIYLDPTTAKLVSEVISWARSVGSRGGLDDVADMNESLAALDAHHEKGKA